MDASPAARRILLTGVTSSTRLLVRHVLQSLGYLVDEAVDAAPGGGATLPAYALVVAGPRALDRDGRLTTPPGSGRLAPAILIGAAVSSGPDGARWRACLVEPLELAQFLATVRSILDSEAADARTSQEGGAAAGDPIDLDRLRDFTGDDHELAEEIAALYFVTARSYLAEMVEALRTGADCSRPSHALKGASANFGAGDVAALAQVAETQGVTAERIEALERAVGRAWTFMAARQTVMRIPA
jgi:HPt (histidine-containing phosphotransfer) domain-containing protein